ncbi:MAG TPA: polyprenyl synthetase family protein [Flavobacteriales bacterium]|nr:polyprenyl synthetase family protein [Flavobacteriales bacterium]HRE95857.1 polyprenyl synthetase family protein [Flavobacteriales bacterium]HRJ37624.1 polyprenyl synthetase family protein [Flavobacteriales bacterium]
MLSIKEVQAPIHSEIAEFEIRFREAMKSRTVLLDKITHYIVKRKGKQMRPMFVFLSAKTCGEISDSAYTGAGLIELLHTATLVHDDVVDDSNERRGFFSLNALWKNKIAVLVGDYLLSKGLLLSIDKGEFRLLQIVSNAVREMSEGELLQIEKARKLNITEEIYYEIIRQKTASLVAACCACGAASTKCDEAAIDKMYQFGEHVGMAFQIKDDIFDFGSGEDIGKPTGIDIKEKKMTLPLIYALNNAEKGVRRKIINYVKNHNEDPKKVQEVVDFVLKSGGVQYATKRMHEFKDKALTILHTFPESEYRRALEGLVLYTVERKK